jgi:hypothetical protein
MIERGKVLGSGKTGGADVLCPSKNHSYWENKPASEKPCSKWVSVRENGVVHWYPAGDGPRLDARNRGRSLAAAFSRLTPPSRIATDEDGIEVDMGGSLFDDPWVNVECRTSDEYESATAKRQRAESRMRVDAGLLEPDP